MPTGTIEILDEVNVKIKGVNLSVVEEAQQLLTFHVPGYIHMPAYKLGRWNGTIKLLTDSGKTYLNLVADVEHVFTKHGYDLDIIDHRVDYSAILQQITPPLEDIFSAYNDAEGKPIVLRDYQIEAITRCLTNGNGVLEMATGSGKTLTCAALSSVYRQFGRVVVIVPNIDLAIQTRGVFQRVGLKTGIWYMDLKEREQITISTWQSLDNYPELFADVICTIVDEAHQAKAKTLSEIMTGPGAHVPFRFGCSGTIPKEEIFQKQILASIGPTIFRLRAYELQRRGVLAQANILQINLVDTENPNYPNYVREKMKRKDRPEKFADWPEQIAWHFKDMTRLKFICAQIEHAARYYGNTLVLIPYRTNGKLLAEIMPNAVSLDGKDKPTFRQTVYERFNQYDNNILICTYGIASTGLDIPRIFNLVMIEPGKKFERVIQTLGRGLRKTEDKHGLRVLDITGDDQFSYSHARSRVKLYKEANQEVECFETRYVNADSQ